MLLPPLHSGQQKPSVSGLATCRRLTVRLARVGVSVEPRPPGPGVCLSRAAPRRLSGSVCLAWVVAGAGWDT